MKQHKLGLPGVSRLTIGDIEPTHIKAAESDLLRGSGGGDNWLRGCGDG